MSQVTESSLQGIFFTIFGYFLMRILRPTSPLILLISFLNRFILIMAGCPVMPLKTGSRIPALSARNFLIKKLMVCGVRRGRSEREIRSPPAFSSSLRQLRPLRIEEDIPSWNFSLIASRPLPICTRTHTMYQPFFGLPSLRMKVCRYSL